MFASKDEWQSADPFYAFEPYSATGRVGMIMQAKVLQWLHGAYYSLDQPLVTPRLPGRRVGTWQFTAEYLPRPAESRMPGRSGSLVYKGRLAPMTRESKVALM